MIRLNSKWSSEIFENNNLLLTFVSPSCFSQGLLSHPYLAVDADLAYSYLALMMHLQGKYDGKIFGIRRAFLQISLQPFTCLGHKQITI